jgi:hypothetical protein
MSDPGAGAVPHLTPKDIEECSTVIIDLSLLYIKVLYNYAALIRVCFFLFIKLWLFEL